MALSWALQGRARLNGCLRVGDELRERTVPRREDLPVTVRLLEDGQTWYSPSRVGVFLRLRPECLARRAGVAGSELDAWPPGPNLQAYLAAVVEVLVKAVDAHGGDERGAAAWYVECAVPEFGGRRGCNGARPPAGCGGPVPRRTFRRVTGWLDHTLRVPIGLITVPGRTDHCAAIEPVRYRPKADIRVGYQD